MLTGERIRVIAKSGNQVNGEIVFVSEYIAVVSHRGVMGDIINEAYNISDFAAQDRYKFYILRDGEYERIPKKNITNLKLI